MELEVRVLLFASNVVITEGVAKVKNSDKKFRRMLKKDY